MASGSRKRPIAARPVAARPTPVRPPAARPIISRRGLAAVAVLATVAVGSLVGGCGGPSPQGPLDAFLKAWSGNDLSRLSLLATNGAPLPGESAQQLLTSSAGDLADLAPKLKARGKPEEKGSDATANVSVSWPLAAGVTWTYDTLVRLHRAGESWKVVFGPSTLHPQLALNSKITVKRAAADRGAILDGSGQPIVAQRPVVVIGLQPDEVKDPAALVAQLTKVINKVEPGLAFPELAAQVAAAKQDTARAQQFLEVVTLRRERYDQIRPELQAMEATHFQESTLPLAPSATFARALLGGIGEVTKEIMDKNPGRYRIGDRVGLAGLQQRYDDVLRGVPGMTVQFAAPDDTREMFTSQPRAGGTVRTTIDQAIQNTADAALAGDSRNTALVAIRISDGAVVAVANGAGGPHKGQLNLALTAQVPPGSTFKAVTALGVLDNGSATSDTVVPCPKTITVEGATYKNSNDFVLGDVPLRVNFAKSCNTAFAALAPKLGPDGLAKTAATLGIGQPWDLGIDAYTGKVSSNGPPAEQAAAAFGQGTTLVSPVVLASATAAVARGQFKQPRLVVDPAPAKPAADGPALKPEAVAGLRSMMREVVTTGTATDLKGLGEAYGKTGTAEFDTADPSKTHAWFMGYRGDLAFAVLVESGGTSAQTAVPLAKLFLQKLG